MKIDKYGRKILCGDIEECCFGKDAVECKYCKSGECEADKDVSNVSPTGIPFSEMYKYVFYNGVPYRRNGY